MSKLDITTKRIQIDKSNVAVVAAVSIAVFVTLFSLVAIKALLDQRAYHSRVISARETARDQLEKNIKAADDLTTAYQEFTTRTENVIGGNPVGSGERDGDNARIILDALPSKYDYPALTTSIEKLARAQNLSIDTIGGVDDEINQAANTESPEPKPIDMPFELAVKGGYDSMQNLIIVFERSIRPFHMNKLEFKAEQTGQITMEVDAKTYFQPEKSLQFKSEVVK